MNIRENNSFLNGFTISETLITLAIIGVVAAITLPTLIENYVERINSERQVNIVNKITKAVEQMKAYGLLDVQYKSTDEFVDNFQKYIKIIKRCNAEDIENCWPVKKIITSDKKEFEIKNAKQGKHLGLKENTSDNVGLVLSDGTPIIITYNQNADIIDFDDPITGKDITLPIGGGRTKKFYYTTTSTESIDFVMDVNGAAGPNREKDEKTGKMYDIRSFNIARFSKGCDADIPDVGCIVKAEAGKTVDCRSSNSSSNDYKQYCVL